MRRPREIADAAAPFARNVRPTRAEIDLDAVVHNAQVLKDHVGPRTGVLAVVKADAYGHGAVPVARALAERAPVAGLAVSLVEEGIELRRAGVPGPLLVMGGAYTGGHLDVLAHGLTPVVSELSDIHAFARAAAGRGAPARVHLKIDTGMSRLGVRPDALGVVLAEVAALPEIVVEGMCTHLASADAPDGEQTRVQLERFEAAVGVARRAGLAPAMLHVANTAGTLRFREAHYDAVRPGLAIYGGGADAAALGLAQVMRLRTAIVQLRTLEAGDAVSYGALWRAPGRARVATLPIGYADGYPRRLTGNAEVLVGGRRCPVVGAVCMDMTLVDVTALGDDVRVGDEAVLLGGQGGERVSAAELAERAGLIEYEITCGISKRVPRVITSQTGS